MKNIENKNFKDEKELAKDFDNQLKGLKADILKEEKNKNKLKENKNIENLDQYNFEGELDDLKNLVGKNIDKTKHENIEKLIESSEETGSQRSMKNSNLKYKFDENRESEVNENIDISATGVDDYIAKTPGFLGNRMRKIIGTEK